MKRARHNLSRLFVLGAAILFVSPLLPWLQNRLPPPHVIDASWEWIHHVSFAPLSNILLSLSPYLVIGGLIGGHAISWFGLLCLIVIIGGTKRERWFCFYACPVGLLGEGVARMHHDKQRRFKSFPNIAPWLLIISMGGAIFGYPFFLWLDPLSIFHGFLNTWQTPIVFSGFLPGTGLIIILILSVWRPHAWCYQICPLGAAQTLIRRASQRARTFLLSKENQNNHAPHDFDRRRFLAIGIGAAAALVARNAPDITQPGAVIRPPGAALEHEFNAICARCGNCRRACPQKIIQNAGFEAGWDGIFTPVLRFQPGYCAKNCNVCNRVCPTSAIRHLALQDKQNISIGSALIDKKHCLVWSLNLHCLACLKICPYDAIFLIRDGNEKFPEVDSKKCRGCGMCQTVCPGKGPAIRITGRIPQRELISR